MSILLGCPLYRESWLHVLFFFNPTKVSVKQSRHQPHFNSRPGYSGAKKTVNCLTCIMLIFCDKALHFSSPLWPPTTPYGTVFKQIHAQRRAAPSCFGFNVGFGKSFYIYQLLATVKLKQREKNVVLVASPLWSIIKYDQVEAMSKADVSTIALPCTEPWGDVDTLLKPKAIIVVLTFLKAGFNTENSAKVLLTLLLQGEQTLLDWSCVCETVKPRSV